MSDANHCSHCGARLPGDSTDKACVRCLTQDAPSREGSVPTGPADNDPLSTQAHTPRPSSAAADPGWTDVPSGPTRTAAYTRSGASMPRGLNVPYFGDYEIVRELGRGGMGVVYEARQVSLNRAVALKLIKTGLLADDAELRRFQNEAEAVALLDHPGIVSAYEVGEHDGQQYLAMKLVRGESLGSLLSRYRDDPRAAAGLVAEAAEAVAHAHSRGILHRDLKPANILVDAEGHPHITDFGLAKRLESDHEMTATGAILGTPAYMSPEQATGHRGGITTATDVYGLGSVLYALLTGRAPFSGETVLETLDALRMQPPEPPTRLNSRAPRDLETICLKCLEKDPRRRYSSAQSLADDLRAWLDLRPISARRIGIPERALLWCKRRPAIAALSALAVVAIVGGVTATIAVQAASNIALRVKNDELTRAYGREARANADLAAANARVEQRYQLAMDAIKTFHTGVSEDFLLKEPKFKDLRDRLLKSAGDFYDRLGRDLNDSRDVASRRTMLASHFELAELTAKLGSRKDALALHRRVLAEREVLASQPDADVETKSEAARSMYTLIALLNEGETKSELPALLSKSVAFAERCASDHPQDAVAQDALAKMLVLLGDHRKQVENKRDEAENLFRRSLAIWQQLVRQHPDDTNYLAAQASPITSLSNLRADEGKFDEAIQTFKQVVDVARKRLERKPDDIKIRIELASSESQMSHWYNLANRPDGAVESARAATKIWEAIVADQPAVSDHRANLAISRHSLGMALSKAGQVSEAEAAIRSAIELDETLIAEGLGDRKLRYRLANSHNSLGNVFLEQRRLREAEAELRATLAVEKKLLDDDPTDHDMRDSVALCHLNIGRIIAKARPQEAQAELREAIQNYSRIVAEQPVMMAYHMRLATTRTYLGSLLQQAGQLAEAETQQRAALESWQKGAAIDATATWIHDQVASCHTNLGDTLRIQGRSAEALDSYARAIAIRERLVAEEPKTQQFRTFLAWSLRRRGLARRIAHDPAGAASDTRRALALWDAVPTRTPEEWFETACCHAALSDLADRDTSGASADDSPEADLAIRLLRQAIATGFRDSASFRAEPALTPLRNRPEYKLLQLDAAMPTDPFAR